MNKKIKTFYADKQVCFDSIKESSYSQSPLKPYLLMKRFAETGYDELLDVDGSFKPIKRQDFHIAHTEQYVDNVYTGTGNYRSNSLPWSRNLVDSLPYTTGSLYAASKWALEHPEQIAFAPVSGMHHAQPEHGGGFCTFSGQVISAIKIYQETGKSCAYLDLDGHFGNSIEDTRDFNPLLNKAIPEGCNINPDYADAVYVDDFREKLFALAQKIINNEIHYVVFAHGADSHSDDDLGGQCGTWYWLECARIFANWVNTVSESIGKRLPVVLALFGGYRKDDYTTVLDLHIKSILTCSNIIYNQNVEDTLTINKKKCNYEF
jgi:acetoin utilization deacetylase AcuC-like enzyme